MVNAFPNIVTQGAGGKPVVSTFVGFLEANRDIPEGIVDDILPALARGEVFHGGGGAGAEFTVRLATAADGLPPLPADTRELHDLLSDNGPVVDDDPDFPDVSDMMEAIRLAEEALSETGIRRAALKACRAVIAQADAADAAFSAHEDHNDAN